MRTVTFSELGLTSQAVHMAKCPCSYYEGYDKYKQSVAIYYSCTQSGPLHCFPVWIEDYTDELYWNRDCSACNSISTRGIRTRPMEGIGERVPRISSQAQMDMLPVFRLRTSGRFASTRHVMPSKAASVKLDGDSRFGSTVDDHGADERR